MSKKDKIDMFKYHVYLTWTLLLTGCSMSNSESCTVLPDCSGLVGKVGLDSCICFETRNGEFDALKLYRNDSLFEIWQNSHKGYIYHNYPQQDILEIQGLSAFYRKTGIRTKDAPGTDLCLPVGERIFFSNCKHCHNGPSGLSFDQLNESDFNPKYLRTGDILRINDANNKHYILKIMNQSDSICLDSYLESQQ